MNKEIETQVLDVNSKDIIARLRKLHAKEYPEVLQKRWVFDINGGKKKNASVGAWLRLRQVGKLNTLAYKNKKGAGVSETEEIEVYVDDFDKTAKILQKINVFTGIFYQENKRKKFVLNDIEFTLDTWPLIPTYLEIETKSEKKLKEGLKLLSLEGKDLGHIGTCAIYEKYGLNLHSYKEVKFGMKK
jgi:adenylate cyclase, class 2